MTQDDTSRGKELVLGKNQVAIGSTPRERVGPIPAELEFLDEKKLILKKPLKFSSFELVALGTVDFLSNSMIKKFYKKSYIYPVGYAIRREYLSYRNSHDKMAYIASIEEKDGAPLYVISDEDGNRLNEATSPSRVWMNVIDMINSKRANKVGSRVSGQMYFGLTVPAVATLIKKYSDKKDRCIGYIGLAAAARNSYGNSKVISSIKKRAKKKQSVKPVFAVGDKVEARFALSNYWFPGKIGSINNKGKYAVIYDDGDVEYNVGAALIRRPLFKIPPLIRQLLKPEYIHKDGDKVYADWKSEGKWFPGEVTKVQIKDDAVFYDISYEDGDKEVDVDARSVLKEIPSKRLSDKKKYSKTARESSEKPIDIRKPVKKESTRKKKKRKTEKQPIHHVQPVEIYIPDSHLMGVTLLLSCIFLRCALALDMRQQKASVDLKSKPVLTTTMKYSIKADVVSSAIEKVGLLYPSWNVSYAPEKHLLEIGFGDHPSSSG